MALPAKHSVTANVQVTGGLNRVVALEQAVTTCMARGGRSDEEIIETADKFAAWLDGGNTDVDHDAETS